MLGAYSVHYKHPWINLDLNSKYLMSVIKEECYIWAYSVVCLTKCLLFKSVRLVSEFILVKLLINLLLLEYEGIYLTLNPYEFKRIVNYKKAAIQECLLLVYDWMFGHEHEEEMWRTRYNWADCMPIKITY